MVKSSSIKQEDPNRKSFSMNLLSNWNKKWSKSSNKIKPNFQNNSTKRLKLTLKRFGTSFTNSTNATFSETELTWKDKWSRSHGSENSIKNRKLLAILQNSVVVSVTLYSPYSDSSLVSTTSVVIFQQKPFLWLRNKCKSMKT